MYVPKVRRKWSGAPILSRDEIDAIAERMLMEYNPRLLSEPQALDVDDFAQNYLCAHQSYEYLSHCGIYLGMTVFNDTNRVPIYDPDTKRAEFISVKANTIIIDSSLLEKEQEAIYRFTMGHECGHLGLGHRECFGPRQTKASANEAPIVRCRMNGGGRDPDTRYWSDEDWMEWQADTFASCLLMPKKAVYKLWQMLREGYTYPGYIGIRSLSFALPKVFNVSDWAASIRYKQLGIKEWEPVQISKSRTIFIPCSPCPPS